MGNGRTRRSRCGKAALAALIDARGLKCPLPVLRARKRIGGLAPGEELTVLATDPAAPRDFRAFCEQAGHTFVSDSEADGVSTIVLRVRG